MKHIFNKTILRAYDIRGIYGESLQNKDAFFVGKSFASFLHKNNKKKIVISSDGRISSPALKNELIKGLIESGLEIIDIGIGPTPMLYFAIYHLKMDAGIMITGSHNPKNHNGFKMALKEKPFFGDDILNLAQIAANGDFINSEGSLSQINIEDNYIQKLLSDLNINKKIKIAFDVGNGAAGNIMQKISQKIDLENFVLFPEIDGNFPNHHPDPTVEDNLKDLQQKVLREKCDIGIAFDGDADRIGVIDDEGEIIWGDQLMIFFAREVLQKNPNSVIIADVKASQILFDEIAKSGGKPLMWKTGHSLVKAKMKETNCPLAGEMSGHIFFADQYLAEKNHGYDDAIYSAIRIINIVSGLSQKLSDARKSLPKSFSTSEIRIDIQEEIKFITIDKIKQKLQYQNIEFNDVDGIRANSENGWWLMRASNTQAALVARCEGKSLEKLEELKYNLRNLLESCEIQPPKELY